MYDLPELRAAVDAWWAGLVRAFRVEGVDGLDARLDRSRRAEALWDAPDLLFAQACGFPMLVGWKGRLEYLATPHYGAAGCEGPTYCSWIVVARGAAAQRLDDLRGARCSINSTTSHSGFNALRAAVAPLARGGRFFGAVTASGSHAASMAQVAGGVSDVAAIDCVTHALLARHDPRLVEATRIIGRTAAAPGLPYVTGVGASPELVGRLRAGLAGAVRDPALREAREALLIRDIEVLPLARYDCIVESATLAARLGYGELDAARPRETD